jgi:hypothetical protein
LNRRKRKKRLKKAWLSLAEYFRWEYANQFPLTRYCLGGKNELPTLRKAYKVVALSYTKRNH